MNASVQMITWQGIAWSFVPVVAAIGLIGAWSLSAGTAIYAVARMLAQLLAVGMVLVYVFDAGHSFGTIAVLAVMVTAASWIAIRPLVAKNRRVLSHAFFAILVAGGATLVLVTQLVIDIEPWYNARYVIPLAGMVFANAMNSVSLSAERFESETTAGLAGVEARNKAMRASLIPLINSLFAVGLVSLPGMMTGQILSGVDPVVAAKYQIVVMCMIFGGSSLSAAIYLWLAVREQT